LLISFFGVTTLDGVENHLEGGEKVMLIIARKLKSICNEHTKSQKQTIDKYQ